MLLAAVCAGDALFPLLASETLVMASAVLAGQGRLSIVLVVVAAAVGALVGDNSAYLVGRRGFRHLADPLVNLEKNRRRLEWTRRSFSMCAGACR